MWKRCTPFHVLEFVDDSVVTVRRATEETGTNTDPFTRSDRTNVLSGLNFS